jgi:MFS transporter, BCD family, chlorophyll transporter
VQASAAGIANALGAILRGVVAAMAPQDFLGVEVKFHFVAAANSLLLATLVTMFPLIRVSEFYAGAGQLTEGRSRNRP